MSRRGVVIAATVVVLLLCVLMLWQARSVPAALETAVTEVERQETSFSDAVMLPEVDYNPLAAPRQNAAKTGIVFLDDAGPVAGVVAELEASGREPRDIVADQQGEVTCAAGHYRVRVAATEIYLPTACELEVPDGEIVPVVLGRRHGWVLVRVVDAAGDPVVGTRVSLFGPGDAEALDWGWPARVAEAEQRRLSLPAASQVAAEISSEFDVEVAAAASSRSERRRGIVSQETDVDGVARFDGLSSGWGYRYGIHSAAASKGTRLFARVEPSHEHDGADAVVDEGSTLQIDSALAAPPGLSGAFFVGESQGTELDARLYSGSLALGRVDVPDGVDVSWAKLVLYALSHVDMNDDGRIDSERPEKIAELYPRDPRWNGEFAVPDVPIDCWLRVRCTYRIDSEQTQECSFAAANVYADSPLVDFGVIPVHGSPGSAGGTPSGTLMVRVVFREGANEVDPRDLFATAPPTALVKVLDEWTPEDVGQGVVDIVRVRLDRPVHFHGVSRGHVRLELRPDLDWSNYPLRAGIAVRPPPRVRGVEVPGEIDLAFEVLRQQSTRLVFRFPEARPFWGKVFLMHMTSRRVVELTLPQLPGDVPEFVIDQQLEFGRWQLLAHSHSPLEPERTHNWVATEKFSVPSEDSILVDFEAGRQLEVRAVRSVGAGTEPVSEDSVSLTPADWHGSAGPVWTYDSPTNAEGVARFVGLPNDGLVITHLHEERRIDPDIGHVEVLSVDW